MHWQFSGFSKNPPFKGILFCNYLSCIDIAATIFRQMNGWTRRIYVRTQQKPIAKHFPVYPRAFQRKYITAWFIKCRTPFPFGLFYFRYKIGLLLRPLNAAICANTHSPEF